MSEAKASPSRDGDEGGIDMDAVYAKAKEIVEDANALLLIALHRASKAELKRREKRLDTNDDAKVRSMQEVRAVRDFVRECDD